MIFFLYSRTDVLSHDEESLMIFFSNSGIGEVQDLDELKGGISLTSGLVNPRPT